MRFHVTDPKQPEWQGCFIEGNSTTEALAKWAAGSTKSQTVRLVECVDRGLFETTPSVEVRQVPEAALPSEVLMRDAVALGKRCSGLDPSLSGVVFK